MALRSQLLLAFDSSAVSAAAVSTGLGGAARVLACATAPLTPGALVPHPTQPNLRRPEEVREALRRVARGLDGAGRHACLLLPDGIARAALLELPSGAEGQDVARFRLSSGLPYPVAEALVDVMPVGAGRGLAASLRRAIVTEYEEAVQGAGWTQERVDLTPLVAIAALLATPGAGASVLVVLGDETVSLAVSEGSRLLAFRSRRRDPGGDEAERIGVDVQRTGRVAGLGHQARVRVVGPGAARLARAAGWSTGWSLAAPASCAESAEHAWLGAAIV